MVYDGAFLQIIIMTKKRKVSYFYQKNPSSIFNMILKTPLYSVASIKSYSENKVLLKQLVI